jgi:hypothetical protein
LTRSSSGGEKPGTEGSSAWDRKALFAAGLIFTLSLFAFADLPFRWQIVAGGLVAIGSYFLIVFKNPAAALTRTFIACCLITVWAAVSWQFQFDLLLGPILRSSGIEGAEGSLSVGSGRLDGYTVIALCVVDVSLLAAMLVAKRRG